MGLSTILTVPLSTMTEATSTKLRELNKEFPLAIRIADEGVLLDMKEFENLWLEVEQVTALVLAQDEHVGYVLFDAGLDC